MCRWIYQMTGNTYDRYSSDLSDMHSHFVFCRSRKGYCVQVASTMQITFIILIIRRHLIEFKHLACLSGACASRAMLMLLRQLKAFISKVTQIIILFLWSIKRVVRIDIICALVLVVGLWCDSFAAIPRLDQRNVAAVAVHCLNTLDNFADDFIPSNYCQMCVCVCMQWALWRDTNWIAKFDFPCRSQTVPRRA